MLLFGMSYICPVSYTHLDVYKRQEPLHAPSMEECRLRIDNLTKPIYSLATLELIAERFAGILANPKPNHCLLYTRCV